MRRLFTAAGLIGALATCIPCVPAVARKWTDTTGRYSVEAELFQVKDNKAILKKSNGTTVAVPLEKLSKEDRDFIESKDKAKSASTTNQSTTGKRNGTDVVAMAKAEPFTIVELTPSDGELTALLSNESKKARDLGRTPFVQFYADWCGPCKALRESLGDPQMADAFEGTYIIRLNADTWKSKLSGTGFSVSAIPVFFEIKDNSKPSGRQITGDAWGANTPSNMAPPLKNFFAQSKAFETNNLTEDTNAAQITKLPADISLTKAERAEVERQIANHQLDPVTSYLTFQNKLQRAKNPPTGRYKDWLEQTCLGIKGRVATTLRSDFSKAQRNRDLQASFLISTIANRIEKGLLDELRLADTKRQAFDIHETHPVWKISDLKSERISGEYSERTSSGTLRLKPNSSSEVLHVTATIENISQDPDPPYARWALGTLAAMFLEKGPPGRIANSELIHVVTPDNLLIPCTHFAGDLEGAAFIVGGQTKGGDDRTRGVGKWVPSGESYKMDIFVLKPRGIDELRLWVLGASAMPIAIAN